MKKFLSTALILAVLTATVTGCSNNNNSSSSTTADTTTSASDTSAPAEETTPADDAGNGDDNGDETAADAIRLYNLALAAGNFPEMTAVESPDDITAAFGIDATKLADYAFFKNDDGTEILIAKAVAGSENDLLAQMGAHFDSATAAAAEEVMFNSVMGQTTSGYNYVIISTEGMAAQEAILADGADDGDTNTEQTEAQRLGDIVQNSVEFPAMMTVDSAEDAMTLFNIDASLCDDSVFIQNMMSVHLNQIIILKPSAGNEETVLTQVTDHFNAVKEAGAFYPDQEASVAGSVMGTTDSGYIYMIVHAEGAAAQDALLAAL